MAIWPVILSGGSGTRLWPLSRAEAPKQLLPLMGPQTMIQATAARVGDDKSFLPPIVVCGEAHADAIEAQLGAAGYPAAALILEPAGRNTAPAIALAALWVAAQEADALILVMPSDHAIADVPAFLRAVAAAEPFAQGGWLVTFGICAERPETGYGYIKMGEAIGPDVRRVERFIEKPPIDTAREYVADGGYAWNGGIFLMRAGRYLEELGEHEPAILAAARAAMAGATLDGARVLPDREAFLASPSTSIDYAVMERAGRVAVAPVSMGWSDIGSWDALHAAGAADSDGNVLVGDVLALGAENCLLRSEGPLVAVVGVSGISVIATADAVLVAGRDRAQEVKNIVDRLKAAGRPECERHAAPARSTTAPLQLAAPAGWAIRPYADPDRAAVRAVFDSNTPAFFAPCEAWAFDDQLARPAGPALVVTRDGRVVAYGGYETAELYNRLTLRWGMAAAEVHGTGVGAALLWARIAHALTHAPGRRWLAVDTTPGVAPFFERNGFERLSDWPQGYGSGLDMVELRLELTSLTAPAAAARAESALARAAATR